MARAARTTAATDGTDGTAVRLGVGHALTVTDTAVQFLTDARRRGELCRPLDWLPEVHHPLGSGEAVIPDALLYYRSGSEGNGEGAMMRAFIEVDRATMGPERMAAKLGNYARLLAYVPAVVGRRAAGEPAQEECGAAIRFSHGCCSSWTAPAPLAPKHASRPCAPPPKTRPLST
ncbi:replication-relaxation family protein [Streptomyces sp. 2231.1]|uniref:replication-relaxation family protein n=1 Tax=Streptomyces sp. 2231.1 TaxID=1855347 RepID=UPI0035242787